MRTVIKPLVLTILALAVAGTAQAGWDEGVSAFKAGNYSVAAQEFQGVVESSPDYANGYFMLGQALGKLNREQDALNAYRKAYDLNPNSVQFQFALADSYMDVGRYRDAAKLFEMIDPSSLPKQLQGVFHAKKATALEKSGRSDQALPSLKAAAQANPSDAASQYRFGVAAFNAGDTGTAVTALGKAVQIDGDAVYRKAYVDALVRQARETRSGKTAIYGRAVEQAKALAAKDASYENLLSLGEAQLGAKQYEGAADSFGKAASKKSGAWLPHFYRSQALTALEQYDAAEDALRAALASKPSAQDEKRIYRQIGFVNEKLKNYEEAKTAYTRAGDQASVKRVQENQDIAAENRKIDAENQRIEEMRKEREKLEKELKELNEGPPPF